MGTYTYDDGSTITDSTTGDGYNSTSATDAREEEKLAPFYPSTEKPWYEQLAMLGATRAIDAHFGPKAPDKSTAPATFAGQNGKTYTNDGASRAGGGMGGMNGLLLAGAAVAALLLLR